MAFSLIAATLVAAFAISLFFKGSVCGGVIVALGAILIFRLSSLGK